MAASLIHHIFGHSDAGLVCPRCEKPLEGHSEADCARKMSRRWFLGATLGAVAGAVVAPPAVQAFTQADVIKTFEAATRSPILHTLRTVWLRDKGVGKFIDGKLIEFTPGDGAAPFVSLDPRAPDWGWIARDEILSEPWSIG